MESAKIIAKLSRMLRQVGIAEELAQALLDIRKLGVCCSFEDWHEDVNSIAVPVRPGGGLPPMAISCGGPTSIATEKFLLDEARPRLLALGAHLEKALGTLRIG